jgi:hypothetical protein
MKYEVNYWMIFIGLLISSIYCIHLIDKTHQELSAFKNIIDCYKSVPMSKYQKRAVEICEDSFTEKD